MMELDVVDEIRELIDYSNAIPLSDKTTFEITISDVLPALYEELKASQAREAALREALEWFIDDDPCWYDHHGYCQAHSCFTIPCHMAEARELLALSAAPPREGE